MLYGLFDVNGKPQAFYSDAVNSDIPENAVLITNDDWQLYLTGNYYRTIDGACVQAVEMADIEFKIASRQVQLNKELSTYIYGIYDAGTQASMQALYSRADTPAQIKSDIESVWSWIQSIIAYYYQCKSEIGALQDTSAVEAYQWDFCKFDATCPPVTLQGIFSAI